MPRTRSFLAIALLLVGLANAREARSQCILANPSFELLGSSGTVFAGWNQFGSVGSSTQAIHGHRAARVSGPNTGGWDVSGYWQQFDTVPGERWSASVYVTHSSAKPLTNQSQAILNIEWRDASDNLISYESHVLADVSAPVNKFALASVTSQAAPVNTVKARFVLGVLQAPTDPVPDVLYDQATFESLTPPTLDDKQWGDFPGGTTLAFSGRTWRVKGPGYYGPGPSLYCNTAGCAWVDVDGRLHLTVQKIGGSWYSTEVVLQEALGYGDYVFTTRGRLDTLHQNIVLGLFLWQYGPCYDASYGWWNPNNEIDVEISRWGNPSNALGQFVAQPYDYPGNISRFGAIFSDGELVSFAFRWLPGRVEFRSWRGGPDSEFSGVQIYSWNYTGPHIPRPEQPRVHMNLWQFSSAPSTNQEVVIDQFRFVPACAEPPCIVDVPAHAPPPGAAAHLSAARPNPFSGQTAIRYSMAAGAGASLEIFDVAGRRVRSLVRGFVPAGAHEAVWDGRDEAGKRVGSGVYLCRFRTAGLTESRPVILLR